MRGFLLLIFFLFLSAAQAATFNFNGSPTLDVTHHELQCGSAPGDYTLFYPINQTGAGITAVIQDLPEGEHFCVIVAHNPSKIPSDPSNEVKVGVTVFYRPLPASDLTHENTEITTSISLTRTVTITILPSPEPVP